MGTLYFITIGLCVFASLREVDSQEEFTFLDGIQHLQYWTNVGRTDLLQEQFIQLLREDFLSFILTNNLLDLTGQGNTTTALPPRDYNVSTKCISDSFTLLTSIANKETFALQMVDALGKPASGILQGNIKWTGSYSECKSTIPVITVNKTTSLLPFGAQYCTVGIGGPAAPSAMGGSMGLILGLCVPSSCSNEDVKGLVNTAIGFLPASYQVANSQCQVYPEDRELDSPAVGIICLLTVLAVIIIISSVYDLIKSQQTRTSDLRLPVMTSVPRVAAEEASGEPSSEDNSEYTPLLGKGCPSKTDSPKLSAGCSLLQVFSVFYNGRKVLTVGPSSETNLSAIHGIRFLSMTWVILGHSYVFFLGFTANPLKVIEFTKRFSFQAILGATVSVDTFFVLSGVLASYLLLKEINNKEGPMKVSWWKYYFHRFWRLTPPYMLLLGAYVSLFYYIGEGPYWPRHVDVPCQDNWWWNFLYINNFAPMAKQCFGWTWYLANDMQFFIITPLLVIPFFFKRPMYQYFGLALNLCVLLASMIATGVITYKNDYPADMASLISNLNYSANTAHYMEDVYFPPWCRIGPYIIGVLVGYALYSTDRKFNCHTVWVMCGWVAATVMNLSVVYGLYNVANGHPLSPGVNAFYAAVHRNAWALGLGWLIFACSTGHGGPVNTLLSWSGFVPVSRLTYMAYLLHPIVMYYFCYSAEASIIVSDINMIYMFLGHLVVTYGLSFVLSLSFEAPMIGLEKILLPR